MGLGKDFLRGLAVVVGIGVVVVVVLYGLCVLTAKDNEATVLEITVTEHVTQLVVDLEGEVFDPYQMPEPGAWQPQFRCRLQEGIDGYGHIVAPVAIVPFTPAVGMTETVSIRWDTSGLSPGPHSVACRLELANWMGDVPVFALGSNPDVLLQTVDGLGWQIVGVFEVAGEFIYLPIIYRGFAR